MPSQLERENTRLRARLAQLEAELQDTVRARGVPGRVESDVLVPAMNQYPGVLVLYDSDRRFKFVNTCVTQIAGTTAEALVGHRDEELFPGDITRTYLPYLERAIATRTVTSADLTVTLPSGTFSVRVTYVPLVDETDNVREVLGFTQDISRQVFAERAVRELEERFGKAFQASPTATVISYLEDGTIVDVNDRFVELCGYSREELVGRDAVETGLWVHPEERAHMVAEIQAGRCVKGMPVVERTRSGEEKQLLLSADKISIGGVECLITLLEDVTEQERAKAQLQESDEQFRALAEHTPDVVVRLDRNLRMTFVNTTAARLTGLYAGDFMGKSFEEMHVPHRLIPLWAEKVRWVLEHGQPTMMEFEYPTVEGPQIFETQLVPELGPDGQTTHVLTVSRNITERTRSHRELEQRVQERTAEIEAERARWQTYAQQLEFLAQTGLQLLKMAPDDDLLGFVGESVHSLAGDAIVAVTYYDSSINQTVVHGLYGAEGVREYLEPLIGADPVGLAFTVTPKYRDVMTMGLQAVAGGLYDLCFEQIPLEVCRNLEQALNIAGVYAIPLAIGEDMLGTVAILSHRPELPEAARVIEAFLHQAAIAVLRARAVKHLQGAMDRVGVLNQELERRATELEAANRELESFSFSVSHDLRTPLGTLDNLSALLVDDFGTQLPELAQKYLDQIRENINAMDTLIQALLQFSRTVRHPIEKRKVSVSELVRDSLDALAAEHQGREVDIVTGPLPDANADPILLKQVIMNLLSNALKFTRTRPVARIEISSYEKNNATIYYVKDNGVGFDMEQADKLFGVFQRLHSEDEYEGTGVGLALVERILRRHGGWVCADAKVDEGATFLFTLP